MKYDSEILALLEKERNNWESGSAYVTDKVSFEMREVIKKARKNYFGIFDTPKDSNTGLDKIWYPVTEWTTEAVVKNIDVDTKDIQVLPMGSDDIGKARFARYVLRWFFKLIDFGQKLNDMIRSMSIDGTAIVKVWKSGKDVLVRLVDPLNFYIDPTAPSIQESSATLERSIMTIDEFQEYDGVWDKVKEAQGTDVVDRNNTQVQDVQSEIPFVTVWERYGKIRKAWVTENKNDYNTWVNGQIVATGIGPSGENPLVHYIKQREEKWKPYEEVWFSRVPGRWHGRGVAEKLFDIQENLNEIINIRANNGRLLQNGIFEIRRGSGITPNVISRLPAGGAIPVTAIGVDIKQLQVQDFRNSSYMDQREMVVAGEKVTLSPAISQGSPTPSSLPATNAMIQDRNSKDAFGLIQEGISLFIKRLISRHVLPLLSKTLTKKDIVTITGDIEDMERQDRILAEYLVKEKQIEFYNTYGMLPDSAEVEQVYTNIIKKMKSSGDRRFPHAKENLFDTEFDVDIETKDEAFDKALVVQQLREMLVAWTQMPASNLDADRVMREILDYMGLDGERYFSKEQNKLPVSPEGVPGNVAPGRGIAGSGTSQGTNPTNTAMNAVSMQGLQQK